LRGGPQLADRGARPARPVRADADRRLQQERAAGLGTLRPGGPVKTRLLFAPLLLAALAACGGHHRPPVVTGGGAGGPSATATGRDGSAAPLPSDSGPDVQP